MTIGERIKNAREKARFKQKELAELTGYSRSSIINWENGYRTPTFEVLEKIASALHITVNALTSETDDVEDDGKEYSARKGFSEVHIVKDQILVPVYKNIEPHCGPGNNNEGVVGEIETYLPLSAAGLGTSDVDKVFGVRVDGSSMEAADISDGSIAIIRRCNGDWVPPYGAPCYVQYMKNGFMLDAIKFYFPSRDGKSARIASAEGSGVAPIYFDEKELEAEYLRVIGVVVSVVESHKPRYGR
ncbi:helix-turn-helix domain-containing protein [Pyramidobacter sp.]|uniref:helix-turn-helix domain-containing protein n=1 Tax=Pyramidobacter sp. TaxID=1943581 RepID=UPI00333464ED